MAKWFKYLFAQDGDKTAIPDATDPTGLVSYQQGYGADYQRALGTDPLAKAIERNKLNQALNDITSALQQYQTHGFPDYIDATTNGGTAYAYEVGAVVRFTDEKNYQNTVASNTNAPDVSGWVLYNNGADAIVAATAKTTPADSDLLGLVDSSDLNKLKKLSWANVKASLVAFFAPLASPEFTGTPTAPTAAAGTNTTQLATTAYVDRKMVLGTAVSASGTSIDFTGIPSWVKRITVMFNGVSTNGASPVQVQLGDSGGIENTGYIGAAGYGSAFFACSSGFHMAYNYATALRFGNIEINRTTAATWVSNFTMGDSTGSFYPAYGGGSKTLSGTLDRIRITTVNGTDTFDAGSINIMYEG